MMDDGEMVIGVIFMIFIALPTIIGFIILMAIKILKGNKTKTSSASSADETKMIQEIYHALTRMEERVDTLETILIEKERHPGARNAKTNYQ